MKDIRELGRYEWHVTFSQKYRAYSLRYYLHSHTKKYTGYDIGLYETKEDAADAFNYLTENIDNALIFSINFMQQSIHKPAIKRSTSTTYRPAKQTINTDFDKLTEIVDRHLHDLPPRQKQVDSDTRAEIDANLETVLSARKELRRI